LPKKKPSLSSLEKKLDQVFSQYVRRSHADEGGTVKCVTCPRLLFWKEADCGHWIKRQHRSVRWDERNVAPQCTRCNHFQGGAQDEFSAHIISVHGIETHQELIRLKHEVRKFSRTDLEELIVEYKTKLSELDNNQGEKQSDRPSELQTA
jgi:hypothetical protein